MQLERPFGVDFLLLDDVERLAREGGIGEQHQVQRDKRAQFGGGVFGNGASELLELAAAGLDGVVEPCCFGGQFVGDDVVLRHFGHAAQNQVGAADGDALAGGEAV